MINPFRDQFPFFHVSNSQDAESGLVYLDNAATTQKYSKALSAMDEYHQHYNANVHRGSYAIAQQATNQYEAARNKAAKFLGAKRTQEIVFTSGTTEAINIIAAGLLAEHIEGSEILISGSEHHANLIPWQVFAKRHKLEIKIMPLAANGRFNEQTLQQCLSLISEKTAIIACAHVSNALGNIYPIEAICEKARKCKALSIIDGTQAAAHIAINVQELGCDFYTISGHKMYAATGTGVLYGRYHLLEKLLPSKLGGEMITAVSWSQANYQLPPLKFEGGTPNIAGALSLGAAMEFIQQNSKIIAQHEMQLYQYLYQQMQTISALQMLGNEEDSIALVSFTVDGMHAYDVAMALAQYNIATRAGHHCAMPLMADLGIEGTVRVSLACYSIQEDVDTFIRALRNIVNQDENYDKASKNGENSNNPADKKLKELIALFQTSSAWNEKHRLLLLQSKNMPLLEAHLRSDKNAVLGCEASVWIDIVEHNNIKTLKAYSNSKVVRGLLSVLCCKVNAELGNKRQEKHLSPNILFTYLEELGLPMYFSQGRRDGMQQVVSRITALVETT